MNRFMRARQIPKKGIMPLIEREPLIIDEEEIKDQMVIEEENIIIQSPDPIIQVTEKHKEECIEEEPVLEECIEEEPVTEEKQIIKELVLEEYIEEPIIQPESENLPKISKRKKGKKK